MIQVSYDNQPEVSFVVPIYNVEKYLEQCVASIRSQTLNDIEIILVDDKSPDESGKLADKLASDDGRIRVVHRAVNGGLGPARNSGMDVACGRYILFVDSDDWVDVGMAKTMVDLAERERLDVCVCGRKVVTDGVIVNSAPHPLAGRIIEGDDVVSYRKELFGALPEKIISSPIPVSAWATLYRRDILEEHALRFIDIRSEDIIFNISAFRQVRRMGFCADCFYNYRKDNQPSITNTVSANYASRLIELYGTLLRLVDEESDKTRDECRIRASRTIIDLTRSAIRVILESNSDNSLKESLVNELLDNPLLVEALDGYPIWKTPLPQAVFSLAMRADCRLAVKVLANLKNG